jgi:hypothetical protein
MMNNIIQRNKYVLYHEKDVYHTRWLRHESVLARRTHVLANIDVSKPQTVSFIVTSIHDLHSVTDKHYSLGRCGNLT